MNDWLDKMLNNPNEMSEIAITQFVREVTTNKTIYDLEELAEDVEKKKEIIEDPQLQIILKKVIEEINLQLKTIHEERDKAEQEKKDIDKKMKAKYLIRAVISFSIGIALALICTYFFPRVRILSLFLNSSQILSGILDLKINDLIIPLFGAEVYGFLFIFSEIVLLIIGFLGKHKDVKEEKEDKSKALFDYFLNFSLIVILRIFVIGLIIIPISEPSNFIFYMIAGEAIFSILLIIIVLAIPSKDKYMSLFYKKYDRLFDIIHGENFAVAVFIFSVIFYLRVDIFPQYFDTKTDFNKFAGYGKIMQYIENNNDDHETKYVYDSKINFPDAVYVDLEDNYQDVDIKGSIHNQSDKVIGLIINIKLSEGESTNFVFTNQSEKMNNFLNYSFTRVSYKEKLVSLKDTEQTIDKLILDKLNKFTFAKKDGKIDFRERDTYDIYNRIIYFKFIELSENKGEKQ